MLKKSVMEAIASAGDTPTAAALKAHMEDRAVLAGGRGTGRTSLPQELGQVTLPSGLVVGRSQDVAGDYTQRETYQKYHMPMEQATIDVARSRQNVGIKEIGAQDQNLYSEGQKSGANDPFEVSLNKNKRNSPYKDAFGLGAEDMGEYNKGAESVASNPFEPSAGEQPETGSTSRTLSARWS